METRALVVSSVFTARHRPYCLLQTCITNAINGDFRGQHVLSCRGREKVGPVGRALYNTRYGKYDIGLL